MKKLLTMLSAVGVVASGASSVMAMTPTIKTPVSINQDLYEGTKSPKLGLEKSITDSSMGDSNQDFDEVERHYEWSDLGISQTIISKMDYDRSWLKLDISYWYSDNSGTGNWRNFSENEDLLISKSSYDSGVKSYEDQRHHNNNGRATDHQWKWRVKVNQEGIDLWDWVWVWANGNWGNTAKSIAGIRIESFQYHFEFLD